MSSKIDNKAGYALGHVYLVFDKLLPQLILGLSVGSVLDPSPALWYHDGQLWLWKKNGGSCNAKMEAK